MTINIFEYIHLYTLKGKTKLDFEPLKKDFELQLKHLKIGLWAMARTPKKLDFQPWL